MPLSKKTPGHLADGGAEEYDEFFDFFKFAIRKRKMATY